jgi:hypothetical protein
MSLDMMELGGYLKAITKCDENLLETNQRLSTQQEYFEK